MKKFIKISAMAVLVVAFTLGLAGQARAATSPNLGTADSFSILAGTPNITDAGGASSITGNVGLSPATGAGIGLLSAQVTGTIYAVDGAGPLGSINNPGLLTTAKNDLTTAYNALNTGANADANCIGGIYPSGTDLTSISPLGPGLYCSAGTFLLTGNLNLTGSGVWVFKTVSGLTTSPGSSVTGGDPCNIWWRVGSTAILDTTTAFRGNILALTSINMLTNATLNGRALARNGAVTLDHNTITNATCAVSGGGILHVVKNVENKYDGDATADDFTLYVKRSGTNVAGSPAAGTASPGTSYSLAAGKYVVSEDEDSDYDRTFSGACDSKGNVTISNGDDKTCTITNNDKSGVSHHHHHHKKKTTPKLPNTGIAPQENSFLGNIISYLLSLI